MSQALTVEKLPQSDGFLHKYESAAVYQEQQEFLEDGKHVSLVGDSVEYLEVEPEPTTPPEPEYYFTGENGQGLYTAKIPARFTDESDSMATYDETVNQAVVDWMKSMLSQTEFAKVRGYAKWGKDGVPYSIGDNDEVLGLYSSQTYDCPDFIVENPETSSMQMIMESSGFPPNWSFNFQFDTENYPTSGDADAYISVEVEPFDPNAESGGNSEHPGPTEEDWVN